MTDRPIIFSAGMIRALLDGRKSQTRRLAWGAPCFVGDRRIEPGEHITRAHLGSTPVPLTHRPSPWQRVQPGDRLWVREAVCLRYFDGGRPAYRADWTGAASDICPEPRWRPSIHMPRWASRLTLTVTEVRRQRLQEISEEDAAAEGLWYCDSGDAAGFWLADQAMNDVWGDGSVECFERLWNSLHGAGSWEANPEVIALTFSVERRNIDARESVAVMRDRAG